MYSEEIPYTIENIDMIDPADRRANWDISFGLQAVDGLKPSDYMRDLAEDNVSGKKTYGQVVDAVEEYYSGEKVNNNEREADFVSLRMSLVLAEKAFTFSPVTLKAIHRKLFTGVFEQGIKAGEHRKYNISKAERVLNGESVLYSGADTISETLIYDFEREKDFDYASKSSAEQAHHVMRFLSGLWQIHPFAEGNTRTCAVFIIQYLRALGFTVDSEPFKEHSQYFRDALVMDNYGKGKKPEYLIMFTENLLLGGNHDLDFEIPPVSTGG